MRILKQVRKNETADKCESEEEHDQEPIKLDYPLSNILIGMVVPEEVTWHMLKSFSIGRKKMPRQPDSAFSYSLIAHEYDFC